ncbi:CU044_5270 family protein [Nonomuraea sp. B19D2]|uniref:CU044_5270 family protein n=1 Tax=Nonomuraea sp. B19D2 TaxID=3159561 RepID=UPI0032DB9E8C
MDELKVIEAVFAEPEPTPREAAAGRARFLRLAHEGGSGHRSPAKRLLYGRRPLFYGGWAATVSLAVVFALVIGIPSAGPASARELLILAATSSEAQEAQGRYTHFKVETGGVAKLGSPQRPYSMLSRRIDAWWYPTSKDDDGWYAYQNLGAAPVSAEDAAAWRAAGSPTRVPRPCTKGKLYKTGPDGKVTVEQPSGPCPDFDTRPQERMETVRMAGDLAGFMTSHPGLDVRKLSADPARLKEQLLHWTRSDGLGGPVEGDAAQLWAAVSMVLLHPEGPVSPQVRAASYRILADVPGVRSLGEVTDPLGRKGQAFTRTSDESEGIPGTSRIIIDPASGQPLAGEGYEVPGGPRTSYIAVLAVGPTDTPPAQE